MVGALNAERRVVPSDQRFGTDDTSRCQFHHGLVMQSELLFLDRTLHRLQQQCFMPQPVVDLRPIETMSSRAHSAGLIERQLGALLKFMGKAAGGFVGHRSHAADERHADIHLEAQRRVAGDERTAEREADVGRLAIGRVRGRDRAIHDRILVAAQMAQRGLRYEQGFQPLGDLNDDLVADGPAE